MRGPPEYAYEKVECQMQGVRDYIKYIKRGSGRTAHLSAIDLRNERISKSKALDNIKKYDGKKPDNLDLFLKSIGLTEKEFNKIVKSHAVFPANVNPDKLEKGKPLHDSNFWDKSAPMERSYAVKKLNNFNFKK